MGREQTTKKSRLFFIDPKVQNAKRQKFTCFRPLGKKGVGEMRVLNVGKTK